MAKVQNRTTHRSASDDRTLCGLEITEDVLVDVHFGTPFTDSEFHVTCRDCQRAQQLLRVQATVSRLNKLTPRQRAFELLRAEVYNKEGIFSPKLAMKKAIARTILLVRHGLKKPDFDNSKRSGSMPICVYARSRGKCHRCTLFQRRRCLHPSGPCARPL